MIVCALVSCENLHETEMPIIGTGTLTQTSIPPTDTPTPHYTPTPWPTPLGGYLKTDTPYPTPTVTNTPCATHDFHFIQVGYPCSWREIKENYFVGDEGYFEVQLLDIDSDPFTVCEILAFLYPKEEHLANVIPYSPGCVVFPLDLGRSSREFGSLAHVTYLEIPGKAGKSIVLYTDFFDSLDIAANPVYSRHPRYDLISSTPQPTPDEVFRYNGSFQDLTYREISTADFSSPIAKNEDIVSWYSNATNYLAYDKNQLDHLNHQLSIFDYSLKLEKMDKWDLSYSLWKDGEQIYDDVQWFWHLPISVNESRNDFVLPLTVEKSVREYICLFISENKIVELDNNPFGSGCWYSPFYIGDNLVTLEVHNDEWVEVIIDGNVDKTYVINNYGPAFYPSPLWISKYNNLWVLEINNKVFINGELLNLSLGYDEVFNWRLIEGKPLFFFRDMGKIRISYNGKTLPLSYDYVEHYNRSSGTIWSDRYNIYNTPNSVSFIAERAGIWYVVTIDQISNK